MSALRFLYKKTLKRRNIAYDDLIFPKTLALYGRMKGRTLVNAGRRIGSNTLEVRFWSGRARQLGKCDWESRFGLRNNRSQNPL